MCKELSVTLISGLSVEWEGVYARPFKAVDYQDVYNMYLILECVLVITLKCELARILGHF